MSLATEVANLGKKITEHITVVKGQFDKWDGLVKKKISWADSEIKNLINTSDNRYSGKKSNIIFVGTEGLDLRKDDDGNYLNGTDGAIFEREKDTFYPVVFKDTSWSQFKTILTISRANVHWDNALHGNWDGSLFFEAEYHISNCGHGSDFYKFNHFKQSHSPQRGFIAKFAYHYTLGMVFWLRGQRHYEVSANGFAITPAIGLNGFKDDTPACGTYDYKPLKLEDITDETQNIVVED